MSEANDHNEPDLEDTHGEWVRIPRERQLSLDFGDLPPEHVQEYFYNAQTGECGWRSYHPSKAAAVQLRDLIEREMNVLRSGARRG